MAQQMPSQPPQRPYSPYSNIQSPIMGSPAGISFPPAKKPRLSPNPASPYQTFSPNSPNTPQIQLPPQHLPPHNSFNMPQPYDTPTPMDGVHRAGPGAMPPPLRPAARTADTAGGERGEKPTDLNDLSDLVTAAGVDLKAEEDFLNMSYRSSQHPQQSQGQQYTPSSTASPNNSFGLLSQQNLAGHAAFQGSGPASQPPISQQSIEDEVFKKHKQAARIQNERNSQPLKEPFLMMNCVRHRLHARAYENGVKLNVEGLFDKLPEQPRRIETTVGGLQADGNGIAAVKTHGLLKEDAPLVDILSLLSLATNERIRSLLDDAYAISRGRRAGADGVVAPEWASLAVGAQAEPTTAVPASVTRTAWDAPDSAVSPMTVLPQKREHPDDNSAAARLPTPPTDTPPTPQPTISFQNPAVQALRDLSVAERKQEELRLKKRERRLRASQDAAVDATATAALGGTSTPGTPKDGIAPEKPITKKERERQAKLGQSDDVLHQMANSTASMALGGGRKKYSWLTGAGSGASTPNPRINTAVGGGRTSFGAPAHQQNLVEKGLSVRERRLGDWKEDSAKGRGIQIRDWVQAVDADGKERKSLIAAINKMSSKD